MHSIQKTFVPAVLVLALIVAGCSAKVDSLGVPAAQTVTVSVSPGEASLTTGQSSQFAAVVTGTVDLAVTWVVDEAGGGAVDASGLYTAPGAAGTYHVRAVSHADPSVSGAAVVTVAAPPPGSVSISPKTTTVTAGGTLAFTATTAGLSSSAVTWSLQETSGCGVVSAAGVYTAPTSARTCHVVATSAVDPTKTAAATITVTAPVAVTVSPASRTMDACGTLGLSATVTGTSDTAVSWRVTESGGGTVTSAGVYTAPSSAGTYHVVATAHASSAATATATITVQDRILSVAVTPTTPSLTVNGTQQLSATVTTTCGTFVAIGP